MQRAALVVLLTETDGLMAGTGQTEKRRDGRKRIMSNSKKRTDYISWDEYFMGVAD